MTLKSFQCNLACNYVHKENVILSWWGGQVRKATHATWRRKLHWKLILGGGGGDGHFGNNVDIRCTVPVLESLIKFRSSQLVRKKLMSGGGGGGEFPPIFFSATISVWHQSVTLGGVEMYESGISYKNWGSLTSVTSKVKQTLKPTWTY